jgi:hypothetical protein
MINKMLSFSLLILMMGCESSQSSDPAAQDKCFNDYLAEFRGKYPESTLKKTAALKCYSD